MDFTDLTPEIMEKAKACKTGEELIELAESEGFDLSEEQLKAISGGSSWYCASVCPSNCSCNSECIIDTGSSCLLNAG